MAAEPSWWNLNVYLAEVISRNLRDMARNGNTVPLNHTAESWDNKLNSIAARLEAYKTYWDDPDYDIEKETFLNAEAKAALKEMADIFDWLWD